MSVPDFGSLLLWGIPLLGLANAISLLVAWVFPYLAEKYTKLIGGVFFAVFLLFTLTLEHWMGLWPDLAVWGPAALWSFTGFLMYMDFYPKPWVEGWSHKTRPAGTKWAASFNRLSWFSERVVPIVLGMLVSFGGTVLLFLLT